MTLEERAEMAVELKNSGRCNCAQAVVAALRDQTELSPEQLRNLASGFCAGMGTLEATCGALIGAGMVVGLNTQGNRALIYNRNLLEGFKQKCGAVTCGDLKGVTTRQVICPCSECVRNAVMTYGEVMGLA